MREKFPLKWSTVLFVCLFDICYPCLGYKTLWSCCWWRFCNFCFLVWKGMWLVWNACYFYSEVIEYFLRLSRLQEFRQFFHFGCPVFVNAITTSPVLMHSLHGWFKFFSFYMYLKRILLGLQPWKTGTEKSLKNCQSYFINSDSDSQWIGTFLLTRIASA